VLIAEARPQFSFSDPGFEEFQKSEKAIELNLNGVSAGDSSTASTVDSNLASAVDAFDDSPSIFALIQSFFG
jgi:hypothetical protein